MRNKVYCIIGTIALFVMGGVIGVLICYIGNEKTTITHHMLNSDSADTTSLTTSTKPLTEFKDVYVEDTRSRGQRLLDNLQQGYISEYQNLTASFDVGDLYIGDIQPKFSRMMFTVSLPYDVVDFEILFTFDTGESRGTTIQAIPQNTLTQSSVMFPDGAKRVQLHSFTFKKTSITTGDSHLLTDDKNFIRLSNNTFSFDCTKSRFFVYDDYGILLDDVTIGGSGTLVTANGAIRITEVEVNNGT